MSICLYLHLCVSALSISMSISIFPRISVFLIFCNSLSAHKPILFIAKPEARYTMFLQLSRPMFPSCVQKCIQTFARLTFRRPITSVTLFFYIIRTFHNIYKCYRFWYLYFIVIRTLFSGLRSNVRTLIVWNFNNERSNIFSSHSIYLYY